MTWPEYPDYLTALNTIQKRIERLEKENQFLRAVAVEYFSYAKGYDDIDNVPAKRELVEFWKSVSWQAMGDKQAWERRFGESKKQDAG